MDSVTASRKPQLMIFMQGAGLALAAWFCLCFLFVALSSIGYPYGLEWMEGSTVDIIERVRSGIPIYVRPSLHYAPPIYTPFYYYFTALVSFITGIDFLAGRIVSLLSAIGIGALLFLWLRRETGKWQAGVIAAGLFYATYPLSKRWFDVGRVDSLFLFLTMLGLYGFYFWRGTKLSILTAVLFAVAIFTKQSAAIIIIPSLLAGLYLFKSHALNVTALTGALTFIGGFIYNLRTYGWFKYYIFDVPAGHSIDQNRITSFWGNDLLLPFLILTGLLILAFAHLWQRDRATFIRYTALGAGLVSASYFSRIHSYGYDNLLMPLHLFLAMAAGLAFSLWQKDAKPNYPAFIAGGAFLAQMLLLAYNPLPMIPTKEDQSQTEKFISEMSEVKGDVLTTELQYIKKRGDEDRFQTFGMAGFDVLRTKTRSRMKVAKNKLERQIKYVVSNQVFDAIISTGFITLPELIKYYKPSPEPMAYIPYVTGSFTTWQPRLYLATNPQSKAKSEKK